MAEQSMEIRVLKHRTYIVLSSHSTRGETLAIYIQPADYLKEKAIRGTAITGDNLAKLRAMLCECPRCSP